MKREKRTDPKQKKRKRFAAFLCIPGMLAGLLLLMLPYAMDRLNDARNEKAISTMTSEYDRYEACAGELEEQLKQAEAYNAWISGKEKPEDLKPYGEQLSFDGGGIMGYLVIPSLDLKMLVYHGTDDATLAAGVGHLEGTSLPVGGKSSHCVLTAHSGMRSKRAFDDIHELKKGDLCAACIYGKEYVYEVESTEVVLPHETESLEIVDGEDRMTLVTCTPYGINDHRLLVHGVRTEKTVTLSGTEGEDGEAPDAEHGLVRRPADLRTLSMILSVVLLITVLALATIRMVAKRKRK